VTAPCRDVALAAPPVPADEAARLEALRRTRLLDSPPEEAFDRITRRLSEIFDAPISLMSLIDETRQFWKAQHGLPADLAAARAHSRETSVCGHAVAGNETIVVEDVCLDARFAGNPFLRERNIRFYAGAPLKTSEGRAIGSLRIIGHRPRRLTDRERQLLELMAETVMAEVEARVLACEHSERGDSARAPDADIARARALQFALAPPPYQLIGRTILIDRGPAGDGPPSGFLDLRQGDDGRIGIAIGDAGVPALSGALVATTLAATAGRMLEERCAVGEIWPR
jgi:GAF domain-containing protein